MDLGLVDLAEADLDFRRPDVLGALALVRADDLEPEPGFRRVPLFLEPADFAFFFAIV